MNSIEFKNEINQYIDATLNSFREYQQQTWSILMELNRLSFIYKFDYYLAYGTLLGAVRDHNQIPWDYDIDTFVKIDDREKFLAILNNHLGDDFYYDYTSKNEKYPAPCLRICKKGYAMIALHVDVFFLIGCPNSASQRLKFLKNAEKLINLRTNKFVSLYMKTDYKSRVINTLVGIREKILRLLPSKFLYNLEERILHKYSLEYSNYWFSYQDIYLKVYPKDIFNDIIKINIHDVSLPIPIGYQRFLEINYGKWDIYLPIKQRFEEFYAAKNHIDERQNFYNAQE